MFATRVKEPSDIYAFIYYRYKHNILVLTHKIEIYPLTYMYYYLFKSTHINLYVKKQRIVEI